MVDITALNDIATTNEDDILTVNTAAGVLSNDTPSVGLSVVAVNGNSADVGTPITLPSGAQLTLNADGSYTYDPNGLANVESTPAGGTVTDNFTYTASDGESTPSDATVTITVNVPAETVDAQNDSSTTDEHTVLNVAGPGVLSNDNVGSEDPVHVSAVNGSPANVGSEITLASGAHLTVNADGSYSYDPHGAFASLGSASSTTDSFTYTAMDTHGDVADATVTITINGVNDAPVAADDSNSTDEDTAVTATAPGLLGNDTDAESDPLTVGTVNGSDANVGSEITLASGAHLTVNADGSYTYDPNHAFDSLAGGASTTDSFTYTATDGTAASEEATVTITINGVNDAPVAADDSNSTDEDTAVTATAPGLLGNDTDAESDPLTVGTVNGSDANVGSEITLASGAHLTVNADGSYTYDPNHAFDSLAGGASTTDSFTYTATDGTAASEEATVTITINGVNDSPIAADDTGTMTEDDGSKKFDVTGNDTLDPDAGALNKIAVFEPTIAANAFGIDGDDISVSVSGNQVKMQLLGDDWQKMSDGDALEVTVPYLLEGNGVTDSAGATLTVTVTGINDAPDAMDDIVNATIPGKSHGHHGCHGSDDNVTANGGSSVLIFDSAHGMLANDTDAEGDPLSVVAINGDAGGVDSILTLDSGARLFVNADGSYVYDPTTVHKNHGTIHDEFTYTVSDGKGGTDTATVDLTVNVGGGGGCSKGDEVVCGHPDHDDVFSGQNGGSNNWAGESNGWQGGSHVLAQLEQHAQNHQVH